MAAPSQIPSPPITKVAESEHPLNNGESAALARELEQAFQRSGSVSSLQLVSGAKNSHVQAALNGMHGGKGASRGVRNQTEEAMKATQDGPAIIGALHHQEGPLAPIHRAELQKPLPLRALHLSICNDQALSEQERRSLGLTSRWNKRNNGAHGDGRYHTNVLQYSYPSEDVTMRSAGSALIMKSPGERRSLSLHDGAALLLQELNLPSKQPGDVDQTGYSPQSFLLQLSLAAGQTFTPEQLAEALRGLPDLVAAGGTIHFFPGLKVTHSTFTGTIPALRALHGNTDMNDDELMDWAFPEDQDRLIVDREGLLKKAEALRSRSRFEEARAFQNKAKSPNNHANLSSGTWLWAREIPHMDTGHIHTNLGHFISAEAGNEGGVIVIAGRFADTALEFSYE
jgi:hypothetical protein